METKKSHCFSGLIRYDRVPKLKHSSSTGGCIHCGKVVKEDHVIGVDENSLVKIDGCHFYNKVEFVKIDSSG